MSDLIERLRIRWEARPGAAMTKINRLLSECREAADRIATLEAENALLVEERDRLREITPAPQVHVAPILKGVGKRDGDGWKDTTTKGEIVFVWNRELPPPYAAGQYPRIGTEHWSASTAQYEFKPASQEEIEALFASPRLPPNAVGEQVDYPKILYVCETCWEGNNEACGNDRDRINVTPDGRWLCEDCRDGEDIDAALCREAPKLYTGPSSHLRAACEGIADDYMTSENHHPGYVLIPTAKFEEICAALSPSPQPMEATR